MKKFSKTHEWISVEGNTGTIGVTNYAQGHLGDVVYVDLPTTGKKLSSGDSICTVESVKAASDVYIPVSGEIVAINEELDASPELINNSAEDEGWKVKVALFNLGELDELMTEEEYKVFCEKEA